MTLIPFAMQSPRPSRTTTRTWAKDPTNDYWQKAPTGTGPLMFTEFVPGDRYTIVKNPNYWNAAEAARLDTMIFKAIGPTRLAAVKAGSVDTIDFVNANQLPDISSDPTLVVLPRLAAGAASSPSTRPTSPSRTSRSGRPSPWRSTRRQSSNT